MHIHPGTLYKVSDTSHIAASYTGHKGQTLSPHCLIKVCIFGIIKVVFVYPTRRLKLWTVVDVDLLTLDISKQHYQGQPLLCYHPRP